MDLKLRPGTPEDAQTCGRICYDAFSTIASEHNFPPDFHSADVAAGLLSMLLGHPGFYSVVAEVNGEVVGSTFVMNARRSPALAWSPSTLPSRTMG
jgi:hypothetical protein